MESYCNQIIYSIWYGSLLNRTKIVSLSLSRISYRSKQSKLFLWKSKASKKAEVTTLSECSWLHLTTGKPYWKAQWTKLCKIRGWVNTFYTISGGFWGMKIHLPAILVILVLTRQGDSTDFDAKLKGSSWKWAAWRKQVPQNQLEQLC